MTSSDFYSNPVLAGGLGLILLTGFFLARTAPPYGTTLLTVHKLIGVGVVVFVTLRARQVQAGSGLSAIAWTVLIAGAAAFLAMIGTGGALSAMDNPPSAVATIHKTVPYFAVALALMALWIVPAQRS